MKKHLLYWSIIFLTTLYFTPYILTQISVISTPLHFSKEAHYFGFNEFVQS